MTSTNRLQVVDSQFAVVASEVRSLAGRSADAAKEIKTLIAASVERVTGGTVLVDQDGATMIRAEVGRRGTPGPMAGRSRAVGAARPTIPQGAENPPARNCA